MTVPAYDEMVELIANGNPERLIAFKPSKKTIQRVQDLVSRKNAGILTAEEERELDYFVWLENLIGLAKAKASQLLLPAA